MKYKVIQDDEIMKKNLTTSILIPAYNEEKSISQCIDSCLNQTKKPEEIIIVNDGSTDKTREILDYYQSVYGIKVINLKKNTGNKSKAQEIGLKYVQTDIFIATDADTLLDAGFVEEIIKQFKKNNVVAICGYIKSLKYNWITACREISYIYSQNFHKLAQSYINAIFVIPGCTSAFNTNNFKKHIFFDHDSITEDLDFTFSLHKLNQKIFYARKAIVYTQDPPNLSSYINQLKRWYGGSWQMMVKHKDIFYKKWNNALELSLVYWENLLCACIYLSLPVLVFLFPKMLWFVVFDFVLLFSITIYGSISRKRIDLIYYFPISYFLRFVDYYVFLTEFFKVIIFKRKNLVWFKPDRVGI
ncbi:MAG: glycosyltransferase [Bacteroidota bacterium]